MLLSPCPPTPKALYPSLSRKVVSFTKPCFKIETLILKICNTPHPSRKNEAKEKLVTLRIRPGHTRPLQRGSWLPLDPGLFTPD